MKAVVYTKYGPPDVLSIEEVKKPEPGNNEALIKIHAAAVNATDPVMRSGKPFIARSATGFLKPKMNIPGDVFAGEIEAVGKDVKLFKPGDRVFGATGEGLGAHAEYKTMPETGALSLMPDNISFEEAAALVDGPLTAIPFLRDRGRIKEGQNVLIIGASGSIGTAAVQLAKHYGTRVTGVCGPANVDLVKSLGADAVIDYTKEDFTTTGEKWDIIFDTVGKSSYAKCKNSLNKKGYYLTTVPTFVLLFQMLATTVTSRNAIFSATGLRPAAMRAKDLTFVRELVESGNLKAIIDRRFAPEDIAAAHIYVETGHKKGNVVINFVK